MGIVQTLTAFEKADNWLFDSLKNEEFRNRYENKFVAIRDKEVVASAESVDELIKILKDKKIELSDVFIEFVYPDDVAIFF